MLNTFEKNISYSLNLMSENNLDIFQNALLFDNNKLITEKDNYFESSFPIENDQSDYNPDLSIINRDNKVVPLPLYENDIIKEQKEKKRLRLEKIEKMRVKPWYSWIYKYL